MAFQAFVVGATTRLQALKKQQKLSEQGCGILSAFENECARILGAPQKSNGKQPIRQFSTDFYSHIFQSPKSTVQYLEFSQDRWSPGRAGEIRGARRSAYRRAKRKKAQLASGGSPRSS